jgi:predicted KAP-like P-loop ATPase
MYEVTFNLPENATYTVNVEADNKDEAEDIAVEMLMNNVITEIEERKIDGNTILNWVVDRIPPESDRILFRIGNTATVFNRCNSAQMEDLAERLYSAFEEFAKENYDDNCTTVEGLFNYCITKTDPDFGDICSIYYEQSCGNFILAF